ncbi:MAG TPA: amino acid permease [Terriglobales bacterium]|jgi:L-asparagine transporter-like permease|nr:amino acid permease [Terriglobales bacterium]
MPQERPGTPDSEAGLKKQLSAGQMAMVGVGGSIGTGLLMGSGAAIPIAGPAVILSFVLAAAITWTVTMALGEMASTHPAAGSFGVYAELYLNPWAGFISRYGYWVAIAIAIGGEMVAAATCMRLWAPQVPALAWVALFSALLIALNLRTVGDLGRFEYWFAMFKLVTILAFVVVGAALLLGRHVPPQYAAQGGFFPQGRLAPLLAMSFSLFTFAGIEMVAISSGEARAVREIPRAVRLTFGLLGFVYLGAIAVLVGVMPWNGVARDVSESPFVTVFQHVGVPAASHVMNFVVLTAALSGANASLYVDSRMLFSLARGGYAPAVFGRLNKSGSPMAALLVSSFGVVLALAMEKWAPKSAYVYLIGAALFGAMLAWLVALAAHMVFRRRLTPQQLAALPMRSPGGAWLSAAGFVAIVISLIATWWYSRITVLSGVLYLVVLSAAYLAARRPKSRNGIAGN